MLVSKSWNKTFQMIALMSAATVCITSVLCIGATNPSMDELIKGGISGPLVVIILTILKVKIDKKAD